MMQPVPSRATGRALLKGVNFLNFIWDKITEWLKGLLVSGILSNLNGLFDSINSKVGEVANYCWANAAKLEQQHFQHGAQSVR